MQRYRTDTNGTMVISKERYEGNVVLGYCDYDASSVGSTLKLDTTGSLVLLNDIVAGVTNRDRIANKIWLKSLQVRGIAYINTSANNVDCFYAVVYDKRPQGALPAISDIFYGPAAGTLLPHRLNNPDFEGRFEILKREDFILTKTSDPAITVQFYLKLDRPSVYKNAINGRNFEEGALYLVTGGDYPVGTSSATLQVNSRVRFVEERY